MIGKGFGKRFEAPSYEEGVGVDGSPEGKPSERMQGRSPALGPFARVGASPTEVSLDDETSIGLEGELGKPFLP